MADREPNLAKLEGTLKCPGGVHYAHGDLARPMTSKVCHLLKYDGGEVARSLLR